MKKVHILCSEVESPILKDISFSSYVSKTNRNEGIDTLFFCRSDDYPLLKKYCLENETNHIGVMTYQNFRDDIITSYFNEILSYYFHNKEGNIVFIPEFNNDIERLKRMVEKTDTEVDLHYPKRNYSFSV